MTISFEQFAERNGIDSAYRTRHLGRHKEDEGWEYDAWSVTLSHRDKELTIPFRMGTGHEGRPPHVEEVLQSLAMDARSVEDADDFEDWAYELGYDNDSRKAEALYEDCVHQAERLKDWLGESLFSELMECEEEGDEPDEEELHQRFDLEILPHVKEQYEQDGVVDTPARREAFNDWIDNLNRDGEISDWLAANIAQPASCK